MLGYAYHWNIVRDHWHALVLGAWLDVWVTAISFVLACVLAVALALFRLSTFRILRWPAFAYVQVMRGIPLLVMLYWIFFGIAIVISIAFTSVQAAIIALT